MRIKSFVLVAIILISSYVFAAEEIQVPKEELAKESVLPVFDNPVSVKQRNVVTEKRIEGVLFYGMGLTEAISNISKLGVSLFYNFNEEHALGFMYAKNSSGLSTYANQLDSQFNFDLARAPYPESTMLLDYHAKAFYGKMSVTKSLVINTSLYGAAGIGLVKYVHKTYPAISLGIGQKFYLNSKWSIGGDLRVLAHNTPIPFLAGSIKVGEAVPDYSQFNERFSFSTQLDLGVGYIF